MAGAEAARRGPLTGKRARQYEIRDLIGVGGMGHVYLGYDRNLDREVAIKTLKDDVPDGQRRRRFLDEIRFACRIEHPYIAQVFDAFEHDGDVLLVMQYVRGRTLTEVVRRETPDAARALALALEIAEALTAIHAAGVVHRDLKPGNVVLADDGHVRVMDFGLATRSLDVDVTESETASLDGRVVGTLAYMAPEQLRGRRADERSDLFAFGVILGELLTGRHPFERPSIGETVLAIVGDEPFASGLAPNDSPLAELARRLLQKDPALRPASAADVLSTLRAIAGGAVPPRPAPSRVRRSAVSAVAALALVAVGLWALREPPTDMTSVVPVVRAGSPIVAVLPGSAGPGEDGRIVANLVATLLGERAGMLVVEPSTLPVVAAGVPVEDQLALLGERARATHVAWVDVFPDGDERLCAIELRATAPGAPNAAFSLRGGSLASLARQASERIGDLLGTAAGADDGLIDSSSESAVRLFQRAEQLARESRWGDALEVVDRALADDPGFVRAAWMRAVWLEQAGDTVRARAAIEAALGKAADLGLGEDDESYLRVAGSRAAIFGDDATAVDVYRRLSEAAPRDTALAVAYAHALQRNGDAELALVVLDRAAAEDPFSIDVPLERSRILSDAGDVEAALAAADRALAIADDLAIREGRGSALETRAFALFSARRYEEARAAYRQAVEVYRDHDMGLLEFRPLKSWADMELLLWNLDEAERLFRRALPMIERSGNLSMHVRALTSLASTYYRQRRMDESVAALVAARAVAIEADDDGLVWNVVNQEAVIQMLRGDIDAARAAATEAARLARILDSPPRATFSALRMAAIDHFAGDLDDAARRADEILAAEPGDGYALSALQRLIEVHTDAGDLDEALAVGDLAVETAERIGQDERLGFTLALRARARARSGDVDGARGDIARAEPLLAGRNGPVLAHAVALARAEVLAASGAWRELADTVPVDLDQPSIEMAHTAVLIAEALRRLGDDDEHARLVDRIRSAAWFPGRLRESVV